MLLAGQLPDRRKELYITEDDCVKHVAEGTPTGDNATMKRQIPAY